MMYANQVSLRALREAIWNLSVQTFERDIHLRNGTARMAGKVERLTYSNSV